MTMLIPKNIPKKIAVFVYPAVCALHGFAFGIIYAPGQALIYGLDFKGMLIWISMGIYFDIIHGISNIFTGMLILPLSELLKRLLKKSGRRLE
jgi:energy-coupling factor transport system substrate-specific component